MTIPAGARLRAAVAEERPLQVVGAINAYCALLAERAGFRALYLSGAGVANASFGLPDLGITSLNDVCEDVRRIAGATELPLLVDADTGWGAAFNIARTTSELSRAGAGGMHLEDQVAGQALRSSSRQGAGRRGRDGRSHQGRRRRPQRRFLRHHGAHRRARRRRAGAPRSNARQRYVEAGADMIFAEALATLDEYRQFTTAVKVPVLANITEFGKTPLFTVAELASVGVGLVLYPLSAFRAMSRAAEKVYGTIRSRGHAEGRRSMRCRPAPSCTKCSAITSTSASSTTCSRRQPQS